MLAVERQKKIIELLNNEGSVLVSKLSDELKVTEETIRRDLEKLEKQEALVSCIFAGFSEDEKKNFAAYNERLYQNVMSHLK